MIRQENAGLHIRNLSVDYATASGDVRALRNITLDVPHGTTFGIVGESGCGKSSLISTIIGLVAGNAQIRSGEIEFHGQNLLAMTSRQRRQIMGQQISVVFQDPMATLNPVRSIGSQMSDIQYRSGRSSRAKKQCSADMLERVGIADSEYRLRQYPHQLSGGMRQRISIAMALMAEPKLLIADEPTTALDATLEVQIIRLLQGLQRDIGCAVLFVSHHLSVVAELCERVAVLYAGEVAEQGPTEDVFGRSSHPYTRRLLQCDPGRIDQPSRRLPTIPGEIPNLAHLPEGCVFAGRCGDAFGTCLAQRPPLYEVSSGHFAACHLNNPYESLHAQSS